MRRLSFAAAIALLLSLAFEAVPQQQPPQAFRVRGTIIDAATGRPPDNPKMKLIYNPLAGLRESPLSPIYSSVTGKFEVDNVPPGSHILQANFQLLDAAARAAGEAAWSMFPTARVPIVVTDKDLEDVALILTRPIAVSGRVRIDGTMVAIRNGTLRLEPVAGAAEGTQWLPPTAFVFALFPSRRKSLLIPAVLQFPAASFRVDLVLAQGSASTSTCSLSRPRDRFQCREEGPVSMGPVEI
jgi:hypothetical protein